MLEVQKFLLTHGKDALVEKFAIKMREYDDLWVLNYNQIESRPTNHQIVCECRNLILSKDFTEVYHRSFDRFFNWGQHGINDFPIHESIALEKMDGSLIGCWHHPLHDKWYACTRSLAFAEGTTTNGTVFYDLVKRALNGRDANDIFYNTFNPDYSFIFELVSPESRVVKPYQETALYALALRNKKTGEYKEYGSWFDCKEFNFCKYPKKYSFNTVEECIEFNKANTDPFDEGFVCYHGETQTGIKLKSPSYLAIANLRMNGAISTRRIIDLVFMQDWEEYLQYFESDRNLFFPYINSYNILIENINNISELYKNIVDQKEFALKIKDFPFKSILFQKRNGKSLEECFNKLSDNTKLQLLSHYLN